MKHVIAILGTLIIALLWALPAWCLTTIDPSAPYGILWIPVAILTFLWGSVLNSWYYNSK